MTALLNTPSAGQSEVVETLHWSGASWSGVQLFRLGPIVAHRYHGDDPSQGSDPAWEADILTVLGELQDAGYVAGKNDQTGAGVDLKSTPASTTRICLTAAGRVFARHPRPRPVVARYA